MSRFGIETELKLPSDQDASGRTLGDEEILLLTEVIREGVLTSTKGRFVRELESSFAALLGVRHVFACASGTAAIHCAIAAINPEPGDEIITSPVTDMGAVTPILYQSAIPVFADIDPSTLNITAKGIKRCLSERTKAIVVTHLFGNPCEMNEIMMLADDHGLPVIEDCAQSFMAKYANRFVGTIGRIGCFSLQQGKHITTGEGGLIATNDDVLARKMFLFINKGWGYGDPEPDHEFLALNYRMTELQGAVAVAQLPKLPSVVERRIRSANRLRERLQNVAGIETPRVSAGSVHTYWKFCLRVNSSVIRGGSVGLANRLKNEGVFCVPRYIKKPAFMCRIFQDQATFGKSRFPFVLARPQALEYQCDHERYAMTQQGLKDALVLPWNENYSDDHVDYIGEVICDSAKEGRANPNEQAS